ncbi:MAG: cysteine-rich KTR domain-containing protein [Lachnospiraceae bacterium]|nr:cysteine-rich KTR domain-containing protein [Lachnospiraceae bacterium]
MSEKQWARCPICGTKTPTMIREDTGLKNFPLHRPKCKKETLHRTKTASSTTSFTTSTTIPR